MTKELSLSQQFYRHLINFYPKPYRNSYGQLDIQLFDDVYRDTATAPTRHRRFMIARAFRDTVLRALREQSKSLRTKLNITKGDPMHDKPKRPLWRTLAYTAAPIIIIIAVGSALNWWQTLSREASNVYALYHMSQIHNDSDMSTVQTFVNDYVASKYYKDTRTDVGYKSPQAFNDRRDYPLQAEVQNQYSHVNLGFDPLICSDKTPTSVSYRHTFGSGFVTAGILATYSYPGQPNSNVAEYDLILTGKSSSDSVWKVLNVRCVSLDSDPNRPYVLKYPIFSDSTHTF